MRRFVPLAQMLLLALCLLSLQTECSSNAEQRCSKAIFVLSDPKAQFQTPESWHSLCSLPW